MTFGGSSWTLVQEKHPVALTQTNAPIITMENRPLNSFFLEA
jgi:hypothetical protein